jgi:hypothetical protein
MVEDWLVPFGSIPHLGLFLLKNSDTYYLLILNVDNLFWRVIYARAFIFNIILNFTYTMTVRILDSLMTLTSLVKKRLSCRPPLGRLVITLVKARVTCSLFRTRRERFKTRYYYSFCHIIPNVRGTSKHHYHYKTILSHATILSYKKRTIFLSGSYLETQKPDGGHTNRKIIP